MVDLEVKAPGNVKFSGEHSVVYNGPSLSAAIEMYATAKISSSISENFEIILKDLNKSIVLDSETLKKLYNAYMPRDTTKPDQLNAYIAANSNLGTELLPYATIAARLLGEQGISPLNKKITIHSEVPIQKGYASSAACSTAFTVALIKSSGKAIDDQLAMDIARDGERIIHKTETAGRLDVGPAYFGGYVVFSAAKGIQKQNIATQVKIVIIDTGPKPPTAEMVKKVRDLRTKDAAGTDKILREIDQCVLGCIEALKSGNAKELGKEMSHNQELLRMLGVSSLKLDRAIAIAVANGAYGAKLCGGGGGGIGIAIVGSDLDASKIIEALKKEGFGAQNTVIALKGAKDLVK